MLAIRSDGAQLLADPGAGAPELGAGRALLRLRVATLGADDLLAARTPSGFVGVLGHECVATVERIVPDERTPADAAKRLNGARVLVQPSIPCAKCETCQRGLAPHCPEALLAGRKGLSGVLAERFVVPAHALVPVPDAIEDERAVMTYVVARALHHVRVASPSSAAWITVIGDGPEALLAAMLLSRAHASTRLLAREESAVGLCGKWGIKHRDAADAGRRRDQDLVVLVSDAPSDFVLAVSLLRARATLLLARSPIAPVSLDDVQAREIRVLASRGASLSDGLALLASGSADVAALLGKRYRLADAPLAFRDAANERGPRRALIVP